MLIIRVAMRLVMWAVVRTVGAKFNEGRRKQLQGELLAMDLTDEELVRLGPFVQTCVEQGGFTRKALAGAGGALVVGLLLISVLAPEIAAVTLFFTLLIALLLYFGGVRPLRTASDLEDVLRRDPRWLLGPDYDGRYDNLVGNIEYDPATYETYDDVTPAATTGRGGGHAGGGAGQGDARGGHGGPGAAGPTARAEGAHQQNQGRGTGTSHGTAGNHEVAGQGTTPGRQGTPNHDQPGGSAGGGRPGTDRRSGRGDAGGRNQRGRDGGTRAERRQAGRGQGRTDRQPDRRERGRSEQETAGADRGAPDDSDTVRCPDCGTGLGRGATYCSDCGAELTG